MGSFWKSLKIEKTYAFYNALLNWSITKEDLRGFFELINPCLPRQFGVRYIRVFCEFPGWPYYEALLWVHDLFGYLNNNVTGAFIGMLVGLA